MKNENIERISCDTVVSLIEQTASVQLVDIRNDKDYGDSDEKIPGSIRATFDTLDEVMSKLNKDTEVVTYCT